MRRVVVAVVVMLAACSGAKDGADGKASAQPAPTVAAPPPPAAPAPPLATAAAPAGAARSVKDESALFSFTYAYPAAAGAIPALRTRLDADLASARAKLRRDAKAAQAEAKANGFPYNAYYWSQQWSVVTELPQWLSLSAEYGNYTGGAHGMYWFGAMLWDKAAGAPRDPLTLFTSKQALSAAIRAPFCAALNRERAKKRGAPVKGGSADQFDECIDPVGQTVILGSQGRQGFDRIGILIPPYEAGPYAEGSYEVTVPVTAAVLNAVKPRFRGAFVAGR